ncbi:hypothetical protein NECAME_06940 [Necator americanus]|uniref:Endonuclease/exonuclease/phosphatase domain-containing protein n=1 Tax=Necator americanus TaxID=51031 RepID=W2TTD4_NECAM|nr:hypothetical protein NECAME_06940 [Necator americanus]ETN84307.1 hypothetical protein NECAME_06940 [Necator americanus]
MKTQLYHGSGPAKSPNSLLKLSHEEEEVEAFYMDLEKFYREDRAIYRVVIGDFNAKVGPRRTPEELHIGTHLQRNEQGRGSPSSS